jgi:hypothetical protein
MVPLLALQAITIRHRDHHHIITIAIITIRTLLKPFFICFRLC